ncbi:MAG: 2-hydroxyacid dehydrogenase [Motilibacteraceae bacterium]
MSGPSPRPWRVGLSYDLRGAEGSTSWGDIGLGLLDARSDVVWDFLAPDDGVLTAEHVDGYDAVLFAAPAVTAQTVSGPRPPRLLARFGVGLDAVDVPACTAAGVAVSITPDGSRRPVATAALSLLLAVQHNLVAKDRLVREGRWQDRMAWRGRAVTGTTVGTFGLGNVAQELFALLAPFDVRKLATDPGRTPAEAAALGVELVDADTLARESDAVVVTAALTPATRHTFDARRISLMRPHAVLVNVARGPIVDTEALADALVERRLAGAGLDVMDPEPLPLPHRLLELDTVVLAPHALAWTDELALGNGTSALRSILDVLDGKVPPYVVNPGALERPDGATSDQEVSA